MVTFGYWHQTPSTAEADDNVIKLYWTIDLAGKPARSCSQLIWPWFDTLRATLTSLPDCVFPDEDEHPAVQEGETVTDYHIRTEQYWIGVARANMGPDAKDKKVAKVALAMAKVFYEDQ